MGEWETAGELEKMTTSKHKCWTCHDTGKVIDLRHTTLPNGDLKVMKGPEDGKPCKCQEASCE